MKPLNEKNTENNQRMTNERFATTKQEVQVEVNHCHLTSYATIERLARAEKTIKTVDDRLARTEVNLKPWKCLM